MPYFASWYYYKRSHVLAPFVMGNILESPYGYCFMSLLCGFVYLSGVKGLSSSMVDMYLWLVQWNCHSQQHKLFCKEHGFPVVASILNGSFFIHALTMAVIILCMSIPSSKGDKASLDCTEFLVGVPK